jgi:hypothetical protein
MDEHGKNRPVVVAAIGAIGLIAAALITGPLSDDDGNGAAQTTQAPPQQAATAVSEPEGRIAAPLTGDRLGRAFTAEGTLAAIPPDRHVWLAVQVDNLLFPKEPEIPRQDRRWSVQVVEGGDAAQGFSLALLMVDADGQREIDRWLRRGRRRGDYQGLERVTGAAKLDVVRDLSLR